MSSAGNFGQEMMRILERGQLDFRAKLNQVIDDYIRVTVPNIFRSGTITTYTVEDMLRRFRTEIQNANQDLLQRFIQVASRQIFETYKVTAGPTESDLVQRTKDLDDTIKALTDTRKELKDTKRRTQTLANLIEEADASIQQLMEERDSLNTSVSETIRKYNEVSAEFKFNEDKMKEYEIKVNGVQTESNTALNILSKQLKEQEQKWHDKLVKEEKKWALKLLKLSMEKKSDSEKSPEKNSALSANEATDEQPPDDESSNYSSSSDTNTD